MARPDEPGNWLISALEALRKISDASGDVRRFVADLAALRQQLREANLLGFARKLMGRISGKKQVSLGHVPKDLTIAVLEAAADESDDEIQNRWAGLLATAMDPASRHKPKKIFISILRSMDPVDVPVLRFLVSRYRQGETVDLANLSKLLQQAADTAHSESDVRLSLDNLARLGCLRYVDARGGGFSIGSAADPSERPLTIKISEAESFRLNPLALSLLRACGVNLHEDWNQGET
jgi:hypothetical protein